jgi:tripartite-type tricarboxylate transporter receptor subunit TctC
VLGGVNASCCHDCTAVRARMIVIAAGVGLAVLLITPALLSTPTPIFKRYPSINQIYFCCLLSADRSSQTRPPARASSVTGIEPMDSRRFRFIAIIGLLFASTDWASGQQSSSAPQAGQGAVAEQPSFALRDMGSFHIGGRLVEISGKPVRQLTFTPGGAPATVDPNGLYQVEQMYVQYFVPDPQRGTVPILMWHGGGLTGVTYESTPDGREGWLNYFVRRGWTVYNSDAVERGRSGWAQYPDIFKSEPVFLTVANPFERFRIGQGPGSWDNDPRKRHAQPGTLFPLEAYANFLINQGLIKNRAFDPLRSFAPVSLVARSPQLLVARRGINASKLSDILTLARDKKADVIYGTAGAGTPGHLAAELLAAKSGAALRHVPYRGGAPALTDLLAEQIDLVSTGLPALIANVRAGSVVPIAVSSEKRSAILPDVPAMNEMVPGVFVDTWYGILAPAGVPDAIVAKIHTDVVAVMSSPQVAQRLTEQGFERVGAGPTELRALMERDLPRWQEIVSLAGIKAAAQ